MESKINTTDTPEESQLDQTQNHNPFPLIPTASIYLSLSTLLPSHFLPPKQIANSPTKVKIPSQISSLSSSLSPAKSAFKSTVSANPLQNTLTLNPLRPSNPSGAAAVRHRQGKIHISSTGAVFRRRWRFSFRERKGKEGGGRRRGRGEKREEGSGSSPVLNL